MGGGSAANDNRRKPMLAGLQPGPEAIDPGSPTWEYIKRIRDLTSMKVFIKGIVTREDAELAVQHGANGVIVSNHGGRAENSGRATIHCLPEVVAGARGPFLDALGPIELATPGFPVYANATGSPYPAHAGAIRAVLADQLASFSPSTPQG